MSSINKNGARLWFATKEEEEAYDDKMIANIELKSLDFEDENFSPVFDRAKQEYFLKPGNKYKSDYDRLYHQYKSHPHNELINKYFLIRPNHTYWRSFTLEKFLSGFAFGYIILREIPLRNFYARCFIMWAFAAKLLDHFGGPVPLMYSQSKMAIEKDPWLFDGIKVFDVAMNALKYTEIPTPMNDVRESKKWYGRQPGHMKRADVYSIGNYFTAPFKKNQRVYWDGTMNMPIMRLADPKHRDAHETRFI